MIRRPVVAGYYYPSDAAELAQEIDRCAHPSGADAAIAVIVPHGSLAQAGGVLGATLSRVRIPRRCIVIGPSHVESWMPTSLMTAGGYRTPLGEIPVDTETAQRLWALCPFLQVDAWGQRGEHSIEVVLPFLQRLGPEALSIVPVVLGSDDPDQAFVLGAALAQVVRATREPVLLIASADFSRFCAHEQVAAQDQRLAACLEQLDGPAFLRAVQQESIVMCGPAGVAAVVEASHALGAARATRAAYATSAQAGGDPDSATGFAGFVIA